MSSRVCLFYPVLIILLMVYYGSSVDRSKFKTCDQSSFCKRCRGMEPGKSIYELDLDTVKTENEYVTAQIINTDNKVRFNLHLSGLEHNSLRLQIIEAEPLRHRFYPSSALDGEPILSELKFVDKKEGYVELSYRGYKIVLQASPFRIDIFDKQTPIMSVNTKGLFRFEQTRHKPSNEEELKTEQEQGMWEENFSSHHDSKPHGPTAVALDFTFHGAKAAYGLPEHADSLHLRNTKGGEPYRFYNLDVFEYELDSTMALYAAIPLLYAHGESGTRGVWWLNPSETWVDTSIESTNVVSSLVSYVSGGSDSQSDINAHFMSESGDMDAFIFLGPTPADVAKQYLVLTGLPPIPPMFSLGYHQCRWNYLTQDDVNSVHHMFDVHDIPMDVMWLDIEHTDGKKYFTWDQYKFSDPISMQHNLTAKGRKLVVIVDPHIKRESGYFLYDDGTANGYFVKNKDNSDYEGWCWPGSSSYLDFLSPDVQDYYSSRYSYSNYKGSTKDLYIWNDMNEPSVFNGPEITMPKDNLHYGGWEHREIHNTYGLYHVMGTYRGLLERDSAPTVEETKRPFILTRSAFSGSQRYTAIWTGDNMAEWSHLKASIPMCLSLALAGFSFCGADVGGFFNNPQPELLVRWYQAGAWLPFYRAHAHIDTKRREPWLFGDENTRLIRNSIRQRYSYLPLWYTLFHQLNTTGEPVIRPMFYHYPNDSTTFKMDDQFLIGDSMLAKPVMESGATQISVYFPSGDTVWYDVDTYEPYHEGYYKLSVNMDKVPVFQRGGSIVAKKERVRRSTPLMKNDPYTLIVALDQQGHAEGELYIDDETTHRFKYRKDSSVLIHLDFDGTTLQAKLVGENTYDTPAWLERVVVVGVKPFTSAVLNTAAGKTVLSTSYDAHKKILTIKKPGQKIAQPWTISLSQ